MSDELAARRAAANEERSQLQQRILKALRKGPLSTNELHTRLEFPFGPGLQLALYALQDEGKIDQSKDFPHRWSIRS